MQYRLKLVQQELKQIEAKCIGSWITRQRIVVAGGFLLIALTFIVALWLTSGSQPQTEVVEVEPSTQFSTSETNAQQPRARSVVVEQISADLYNAAAAGDVVRVQRLLSQGASPDGKVAVNMSTLFANLPDEPLRERSDDFQVIATPLFAAAAANQISTIRALLAAGASVDSDLRIQDSDDDRQGAEKLGFDEDTPWCNPTPVIVALLNNRSSAASLLIEAGCAVDNEVFFFGTPLVLAVERGDLANVELLLGRGANPDDRFEALGNQTCLQLAACAGRLDLVKALVEAGADVNAKGAGFLSSESTALDDARKYDHEEVVNYLIGLGAKTSNEGVFVIIVPGTYGNESDWPKVGIEGKTTFGSELLKVLPNGSKVYPGLWASSVAHENRVQAAKNLVEVIDRYADQFSRVCLVGHSHGGNVCLLAAGMCKSPIDMVICLSTPQVHLQMKELTLPVYCTFESAENTRHIINIVPSNDSVVDFWANFALGLSENEAIRLTTGWRENLNHPRLASDTMGERFLGVGNIEAFRVCSLTRAMDVTVWSHVSDGIQAHNRIHSRRMGSIIGRVIAEGPTEKNIAYLKSTYQPSNTDDGSSVAESDYSAWVRANVDAFQRFGWRLEAAEISLTGAATALDAQVGGGGGPDPFLVVHAPETPGTFLRRTPTKPNTTKAFWHSTDLIVKEGERFGLSVWDDDTFLTQSHHHLGGFLTTPGSDWHATSTIRCNGVVDKATMWSGEFLWTPVHY